MEFLIDSAAEVATSVSEPSQPWSEFTRAPKGGNKKRSFCLQSKQLFLTFPQLENPPTKEQVLERLRSNNSLDIKGVLIAQEPHKGEASLFWL